MRFLKSGITAIQKIRNLSLDRMELQVAIIGGLTLAYIVIFRLFIEQVGPVLSVFLAMPVVAVGLYYGRVAGVIASLGGFALNIFLLIGLNGFTITQVIRYWPGYLAILIMGYVAGYLHDETIARNQVGNELASRERFIALISIATKNITSSKKPDDAYYRLISHLTNLFIADYAYLIHWDEINKKASLISATKSLERSKFPFHLKPEEENLIKAVLKSRHPMTIEDVQKSTYIINPSPYKNLDSQTKSALILPLITEDYCFGAVTLAFDSPRRFTKEENVYVELVGNQIALALRTLQQQIEIETQLKESKALADIGRALSESERVGVDKVLQLIVDSAMELIPKANNVILHLLDKEKRILVPRAVAGYVEKAKGKLNMRPGEGIAGQVMSSRTVIRIADVHSDQRFLNQTVPVKFRSLVVAPIKSHDDCIGTISIQSDIPNAFDNNEVGLLETLGTQVSIGIDNANLLETLEQRVQRRTHDLVVLYNLITIISENWQLQDLLELSLVLTLETVKADRGIIYLVDGKEHPGLKPVIQRGFSEGIQIDVGSLPDDELARDVFRKQKPLALENLAENPAYAKFGSMNFYAGIPIMARGEMRGVFSLFAKEKNVFRANEMALLTSIADHLGIGIENSILWEQSRENAAIEERNRLARNLHDSVSQLLYSLTLMAGTTRKMLEHNPDLDAIRNSVGRFGDTAHQALKEMRLLLYELRPAVLDSEGLVSALRHRIGTVEERLGVKVDLQARGVPELPSDMEDALYHIALEALNNIVKHSEGKIASISLSSKNGSIVMEISDEGKGFDINQPERGQGLRNMYERVQMLGGEMSIDSKPGEGTRITACLKIPSDSLISS